MLGKAKPAGKGGAVGRVSGENRKADAARHKGAGGQQALLSIRPRALFFPWRRTQSQPRGEH